ncbi:MAG: LysR substrate-binding domain-containing protein [Aureispira sp.]
MPSIAQLEYIVAVDRERHFGIAAKQCFVTQPTLSAQIKKAEELLGVSIFDRQQHPIIPTRLGQKIIAQAKITLQEHHRLKQLVDDNQNNLVGTLSIGIIPTIAPYLLPLFVGDFVRTYPKIDLQIKEQTTAEIIEGLKTDQLDLGILVTPIKKDFLIGFPLYYENFQLYVHPNHPFAKNDPIPLTQLRHQEMWLLSQGHCFRNQVINLCPLQQTTPIHRKLPFSYQGHSFEALQRLVDLEGGYTLLPELVTLHHKKNVRSLQSPIPLREVSLVARQNYGKKKLLNVLQKVIQKAVPKHLLKADRGQIVEWR